MSESKELATYEASSMDERMTYARMIAEAGDLVPSGFHDPVFRTLENGVQVKVTGQVGPVNPGKVFLAFEYGAMLGLHPLAALMGIHVIEGKPSASAGLISSLVRTAGHRLRVTTEGEWDDGTFKAIAELVRSDDEDFTFRAVWTKRDAERAGLLGKDNWKNYPRSMAKARAITEVAREGAEEALLGVHYTPEELGATVDANGEVLVIAEVEEAPEVKTQEEPKSRVKRATNGRQGTRRKASTAGATTAVPMPGDVVDAEVVTDDDPSVGGPASDEASDAEQDEREERARIAAEQEAAERAKEEAEPEPQTDVRAARMPDALPGETEVDYQQRKLREREEAAIPTTTEYVDEHDGSVYASQAELDAAIKARVQANRAARAAAEPEPAPSDADAPTDEPWPTEEPPASSWDVAISEEPTNWARLTEAAENQTQLKHVWTSVTSAQQMTTELRARIVARKAELPE